METREVRWEVRLRGEENHFFQKKPTQKVTFCKSDTARDPAGLVLIFLLAGAALLPWSDACSFYWGN